jgi:hypothetical protein
MSAQIVDYAPDLGSMAIDWKSLIEAIGPWEEPTRCDEPFSTVQQVSTLIHRNERIGQATRTYLIMLGRVLGFRHRDASQRSVLRWLCCSWCFEIDFYKAILCGPLGKRKKPYHVLFTFFKRKDRKREIMGCRWWTYHSD